MSYSGMIRAVGVLILTLLLAASAVPIVAQMQRHDVGLGASLELPGTWVADSDSALGAARRATLNWMADSDLPELREMARNNQNVLLFAAEDTLDLANSANLNVTFGEASTRTTFADADEAELQALVNQLCARFQAQAAEVGGSGECQGHQRLELAGRTALVLRHRATIPSIGMDNLRTVAMLPGDGYLLTLSISLGSDSSDSGLAGRILESMRMPAGG